MRVPGVSAAELGQINLGCGEAYGGEIGHVNPTPGPGETQGPLVRDAVHAYNVLRFADGDLQVAEFAPPAPDGATGYHSISVRVD